MASMGLVAGKPALLRPLTSPSKLPSVLTNTINRLQLTSRSYATHSGQSSGIPIRRQVTVANDDGRVQWRELSAREKVARSTQQSFNFLIILVGIVMTGGVATYLYFDVFSTDSKTIHFNRAVNRVKKDQRCLNLLGPADKLSASAYVGGEGGSRMFRSRKFASREERDRFGTEHLHMDIQVRGPRNQGLVKVHMAKRQDQKEHQYVYLALDVKGHQRVYLEDNRTKDIAKKAPSTIFGIRWR